MSRQKSIIVIAILILTVVLTYTLPRARYRGSGFISGLNLPVNLNGWQGRDITDHLNLNFDKNWNKFISEALVYTYKHENGSRLVFIILDAGNFHHPNVCFTASGYEIQEMDDTIFSLDTRSIKAHTLLTERKDQKNVSFYWIIIDGQVVENWVGQKIRQLYYSLFNRKRVGLMVRIDIPTLTQDVAVARNVAQQFISELSRKIEKEKADFIFGRKS